MQNPYKAPASSACDWTEVSGLQQRMAETVEAMNAMADEVGLARQIREFSSDQRKRVLAIATAPFLKAGASAAAAEIEARGGEPYKASLNQLAKDLLAAEQTIARWDAKRIEWESCRSLLSMQRETARSL